MENIKQSESKKMQLTLDPNKTMMGSSGGLAIVGSAGLKAAKGAFNLIKSVMKKRTTSIKNPIEGSNKAYNKLQYPTGKKNYTSKPVDFKGPNPAHKTGAGGNSY